MDQNRLRSTFARMMLQVWTSYSQAMVGHQCAIFGFFSKHLILPSQELSDAVKVSMEGQLPEKTPKVDLAKLAAQLNITENTVTAFLKQMMHTIVSILTKRKPFSVIKISMSSRTLVI